jgi:mono/diheme cytochrome c family protein
MVDQPHAFEPELSDDDIVAASMRVDREAEVDVERLHRPIVREPGDPEEGHERVPVWLWMVAALALFWGGWYLGRTGGSFDTGTHLAFRYGGGIPRDAAVTRAVDDMSRRTAAEPVARGAQVFSQQCQACHQENGLGLPDVFPPVVGSAWVTGPEDTLVRILLHGLEGPVDVAGRTFNGRMPAWRDALADEEIAAVATYIRQWAPNTAPAVQVVTVAELRKATASRTGRWSADELRSVEQVGKDGGAKQ